VIVPFIYCPKCIQILPKWGADFDGTGVASLKGEFKIPSTYKRIVKRVWSGYRNPMQFLQIAHQFCINYRERIILLCIQLLKKYRDLVTNTTIPG